MKELGLHSGSNFMQYPFQPGPSPKHAGHLQREMLISAILLIGFVCIIFNVSVGAHPPALGIHSIAVKCCMAYIVPRVQYCISLIAPTVTL